MGDRAHVHIEAPTGTVFRYLAELHDAEWRRGVQAMRLLSATHHAVGSRHVEVRTMGRRTVETEAEVVVYEPDRHLAIQRASGPVRPRVDYLLAPAPDGTTDLTFRFSIPVLRGPARLLWPATRLAPLIIERATGKDLEALAAAAARYTAGDIPTRG